MFTVGSFSWTSDTDSTYFHPILKKRVFRGANHASAARQPRFRHLSLFVFGVPRSSNFSKAKVFSLSTQPRARFSCASPALWTWGAHPLSWYVRAAGMRRVYRLGAPISFSLVDYHFISQLTSFFYELTRSNRAAISKFRQLTPCFQLPMDTMAMGAAGQSLPTNVQPLCSGGRSRMGFRRSILCHATASREVLLRACPPPPPQTHV